MKTILNTLLAAALSVSIAACALLQPVGGDDDARRAAKVTLTAYEAAQEAILIYGRMPACDPEAGVKWMCRDPELWAKIKVYERAATAAIAEATPVLNGSKADAGQLLRAIMAIDRVKSALKEASVSLSTPAQLRQAL